MDRVGHKQRLQLPIPCIVDEVEAEICAAHYCRCCTMNRFTSCLLASPKLQMQCAPFARSDATLRYATPPLCLLCSFT